MSDFGDRGPILGPFPFFQTTYGDSLKFGMDTMVTLVQGLIFYGGTWYGDWSVISQDTVVQNDNLKCRVESFDPAKAEHTDSII
jgi:hypothetical protein